MGGRRVSDEAKWETIVILCLSELANWVVVSTVWTGKGKLSLGAEDLPSRESQWASRRPPPAHSKQCPTMAYTASARMPIVPSSCGPRLAPSLRCPRLVLGPSSSRRR